MIKLATVGLRKTASRGLERLGLGCGLSFFFSDSNGLAADAEIVQSSGAVPGGAVRESRTTGML